MAGRGSDERGGIRAIIGFDGPFTEAVAGGIKKVIVLPAGQEDQVDKDNVQSIHGR
jgi:hypothetical protein